MASSRSLRSRQKQTRLQFQPLASSSPLKDQYSDAVQDRLAKIRFQGARNPPAPRQDDEHSLPTPQPTSPVSRNLQVASPSSPLTSLRTSPVTPPRFAIVDSEELSEDDVIAPPSSKRRKLSDRLDDTAMDISSSATSSEDLPTTSNSNSKYKGKGSLSTQMRRSTRITRQMPTSLKANLRGSTGHVASTDIMTSQNNLSNLASPETSDDDDVMATAPNVRRKAVKAHSKLEDDFIVEDGESDLYVSEDDIRTRKSARSNRGSRDFVVDNDEVEYITSDEDEIQPRGSSTLQKSSPKHKIGTPRSKQRSRREQEELAEDLLDLQDSEPDRATKTSRTRGGPVNTQRDKARGHFELLKRRRAGERAPRITDSEEDDESWRDDDGVHLDGIGNEPETIEIASDRSVISAGADEQDQGTFMDDEDDFVVDDQVATSRLGRPNTDIPLQFTSFASAKPRELFPHIIEWMVKNKISPAFNRHDDVYKVSFSRVDDQVKAQAGSRLISSAWNATFRYSILARPGLHVVALPGLDEELIRTCDACNKPGHPARYELTLSGKAYSKATLEPIDDSESDEEDEEENADGISRDEQGHGLASTNARFFLGRFCAANAEMGHKLTHWKHHLNEQVLSYLEEQGVLSAEAIVRREKLNKKKREKEAENIVDMMQETSMIAELWQAFQDDLEDARIGMEGHERKGGRSKHRIGSIRVQKNNGTVGEWVDGGRYKQTATRLESDSEGE